MTTPTIISTAPPPTPLSHLPSIRISLIRTTTLNLTARHLRRCAHPPIRCSVAAPSSISDSDLDDEVRIKLEKVGSRVRVKAPMKVYHVPRVPEVELTPEMEGVVKQYVGFWKGKRITANYPFKIQFSVDVEGRGEVKFFVHLKEDEFNFVE